MKRIKKIIYLTLMVLCLLKQEAVAAESMYPSNPTISNGTTTWDCVYFGNFPQKDVTGNTKEPIKWRVLSVNGNDAFLMSDKLLYQMNYRLGLSEDTNLETEDTNWESSVIRTWLNSYGMEEYIAESSALCDDVIYGEGFLNTAFSSSEQDAILKQTISGCDDYVYLPSGDEVTTAAYGFSTDEDAEDTARVARITEFAGAQAAGGGSVVGYGAAGCYWSRDFSKDAVYTLMNVNCMEEIHLDGSYRKTNFWLGGLGVRPVLHIDLSKSVWTDAGTVSSDLAEEKVSGDYTYYVYDGEAVITAYNGQDETVTVPASLGGYSVGYIRSLAPSAVESDADVTSGETIKYLTIPDSVWGIQEINQDNLKTISFGKGIKEIPSNICYEYKYLTTVKFNSSLTKIGDFAFCNCTSLKQVTIPQTVETIGECAFSGCGGEAEDDDGNQITALKLIVEKGSEGERYAKENGIDYVYTDGTLPEKNIDEEDEESVTGKNPNGVISTTPTVTLPATSVSSTSVSSTSVSPATQQTDATSSVISKNNAKYKITTDGSKCEVTYMGSSRKNEKKVTIPASITVNGKTYKVTAIANGAFKNNKKLTSVVIGKNVVSVGKEAFKGCTKLKKVTVKSTRLKKVGKGALKDVDKNVVIKVPKEKLITYKKIFQGKGQKSTAVMK